MRRRAFLRHTGAAFTAGVLLPSGFPMGGTRWTGTRADLVLRRATVYDGSGGPPFLADVAITGGRIESIDHHWLIE